MACSDDRFHQSREHQRIVDVRFGYHVCEDLAGFGIDRGVELVPPAYALLVPMIYSPPGRPVGRQAGGVYRNGYRNGTGARPRSESHHPGVRDIRGAVMDPQTVLPLVQFRERNTRKPVFPQPPGSLSGGRTVSHPFPCDLLHSPADHTVGDPEGGSRLSLICLLQFLQNPFFRRELLQKPFERAFRTVVPDPIPFTLCDVASHVGYLSHPTAPALDLARDIGQECIPSFSGTAE